ncbi:MAG TPA: serine/threonine-protein kinase [Candidatus Xenobia bacterium]|jgi:serine/threonine protein kinase
MLPAGTRLQGKYLIERILGQGGMGAVYQAVIPALGGKRVAIKEMMVAIENPAARQGAVRQFKREAELLALLDHPGLVDVSDAFEENGNQYLVMALIEGITLEGAMQQTDGFLGTGQVLGWVSQLMDVLEYLHTQTPPIIFRDLKPTNIMLDARQRVRLIDFGIARSFDTDSHTTTIIKGACTPGFSPVEQFGGGTTDARSDIYALGATMFMLLTRAVPPVSVQMMSGEDVMRDPVSLNPAIPRALGDVILKMMGQRKTDRYQTIGEVRAALYAAMTPPQPAPVAPVPFGTLLPPPRPPEVSDTATPRRSPVPLVLGSLAFAGLLVVGVWVRHIESTVPVAPSPVAVTPSSAPLAGGSNLAHTVDTLASGLPHLLDAAIVFKKLSPGVTILVDGQPVTATEGTHLSVPAGRHEVRVQMAHYERQTFTKDLQVGEQFPVVASLRPLQGHVEVQSTPAGARVSVAGHKLGTTPVAFYHPPGEFTITVEKPGFRPRTHPVKLAPEDATTVQVALEPSPAPSPPPPPVSRPAPVYHTYPAVHVPPAPPPGQTHVHSF